MTDKQLVKFCTSFRNGVIGRKSSLRECFKVCWPLQGLLLMSGIDVGLTEGVVILSDYKNNAGIELGHYWLTFPDGRIIDPTGDQFNSFREMQMPKVYLGEKPADYKPNKS